MNKQLLAMSNQYVLMSTNEGPVQAASVGRGRKGFYKKTLLIAHGALLLASSSCHRNAVPTVSTAGPGTSVKVAESKVLATNTSFQYLNAKGKAQVNLKGNKQNANISLRLRRDSVIWVSAGLAGFEGVRAVLTPDSVRVINRLEKTFFSGGYDYLSKLLNVPVSFGQMQAILLGDYLPAPTGTTPKVTTEEAGRQRVSYPLAGVLVERLLQPNTGRVQQLKVSDAASKRDLTVDYTDFQPLEGAGNMPFAHATFIQAQQPAAGVATAALNYSKVEVGGKQLDFPFSVPKGYKRMK